MNICIMKNGGIERFECLSEKISMNVNQWVEIRVRFQNE